MASSFIDTFKVWLGIDLDKSSFQKLGEKINSFNTKLANLGKAGGFLYFVNKFTNFFAQYDIIVGDIAYSKLRLKGFNNKDNKNFNKINDSKNIEKYIKENCAYDCKYFILEKINDNQLNK